MFNGSFEVVSETFDLSKMIKVSLKVIDTFLHFNLENSYKDINCKLERENKRKMWINSFFMICKFFVNIKKENLIVTHLLDFTLKNNLHICFLESLSILLTSSSYFLDNQILFVFLVDEFTKLDVNYLKNIIE